MLEVSAAKDTIINGTLGLGHVAAGAAVEAAEEMVRLVRVGMEAGATWYMCAGRAKQVRRRRGRRRRRRRSSSSSRSSRSSSSRRRKSYSESYTHGAPFLT